MLTSAREHNALINLFHQGTKIPLKKGEVIASREQSRVGIFFISEGIIKTYDTTKYGEENLLTIRKKGEVFGLTKTLADRGRDVSHSALEPSVVFHISRDDFVQFLKTNPTAALPLVDILIDMYRVSSERIMTLEYRTVRERLASFLIMNIRRFGVEIPDGVELRVPLRHQDIASSISATRETTSRELATLERQGIVQQGKHSVLLIKDVEKLKKYTDC